MIIRCWMHWFWITFLVMICIKITVSHPIAAIDTHNKQVISTALVPPIILSTTSSYEFIGENSTQLQIPTNDDGGGVGGDQLMIGQRTGKAIVSTESRLHIDSVHLNHIFNNGSSDLNKTLILQNKKNIYENSSDDKNRIDNRNISDNDHDKAEGAGFTKLKLVTNRILMNVTMDQDNSEFNNTFDVNTNTTENLISPANDQKRKELIIEDVDITPTEDDKITIQETSAISNDDTVDSVISDQTPESSELSATTITCSVFGVLIFATLIGAISFVLYRRRYLNKPHSLNDKCSNLDSSGYIDDSTMRENSEEMYSLDNDSFLNSLEAMTIQNYWTDHVKHTKL